MINFELVFMRWVFNFEFSILNIRFNIAYSA